MTTQTTTHGERVIDAFHAYDIEPEVETVNGHTTVTFRSHGHVIEVSHTDVAIYTDAAHASIGEPVVWIDETRPATQVFLGMRAFARVSGWRRP